MRPRWLLVLLVSAGGLALAISASWPTLRVQSRPSSSGIFYDTGQLLGNATSQAIALADLDGDTDLDAFVANSGGIKTNEVWLNNGAGWFSSNGQSLGNADSEDIVLSDVDGANGLDAIAANSSGLNQVWISNGAGQAFEAGASRGAAAGNLGGDPQPDIFFANQSGNTVWINQSGVFTSTGQSLGTSNSFAAALGDLDGDGDLDAFVANGGSGGQPDKVWINQGGAQMGTSGAFLDSGQDLGSAWTYDVALGDLDSDGDLDAFTAHWFPAGNQVWINQGGTQGGVQGTFVDSGQTLGSAASIGVALADVDSDNDLDAFVANNFPDGSQVWLNNGSGVFTDSGQALGANATSYNAALDDLDGDNDPDAFVASFGPNRIFRNGSAGLPIAAFDVPRQTNPNGDDVFYQAITGNAILPILLSHTLTETIEVHAGISGPATILTDTLTFDPGQQLQYLNLVNPNPNPDETYTLTLSVTPEGIPPTPSDQSDRLLFVFIAGDQGMEDCVLCYIEWLGQFVGIDPIFDQLHHLSLEDQRNSPLWPYYTALFDHRSPELSSIMATNPPLLWDALQTIDEWTPAVQALSAGSGSSYTITQEMADDAIGLIDGIKAEASPALQAAIQREQDALDLPSLSGLTLDEAWQEFQLRRPAASLYLTIIIKN